MAPNWPSYYKVLFFPKGIFLFDRGGEGVEGGGGGEGAFVIPLQHLECH